MGWATWLRTEHDQLWVGLWGNSFGASVGLALATRPAAAASMRWCWTAQPSSPMGCTPA